MINVRILLFNALLIVSCSNSLSLESLNKNEYEITQDSIMKHIKYLSSDELEGRYPGSPGSDLAIKYIENHYTNLKLNPFKENKFLDFFEFSDIRGNSISVPNVVGVINGNNINYRDEVIVIGAHFDHLGMGGNHSGSLELNSNEIHNGADDNASGVSGLLELAKKLFSNKSKLNRSIVFVAFNAEEQGIFGSKSFVKSSFFDSKKIVSMINLDMIGRMKNSNLYISGTGTSPIFSSMLDSVALNHNLNLNKNPDGFGPSDHASFYVNDIPVLFFFTGAHSDYHRPSDDWQKINARGLKMSLDMIYDVAIAIDQLETAPQFSESGPKSPQQSQQNLKVTFGIMPSYGADKKGLAVDGVRKDGPAGKAGLVKGDIISEIDGKSVNDIYGYMEALKDLEPGGSSVLKVIRKDSLILLTIKY